jgi:hypothetical protein
MILRLHGSPALSVTLQLVTVFSLSALLTRVVFLAQFRSAINILWMLVVPLTLGFLFNRALRRTRMMILLPVASFMGPGFVAVLMGYP